MDAARGFNRAKHVTNIARRVQTKRRRDRFAARMDLPYSKRILRDANILMKRYKQRLPPAAPSSHPSSHSRSISPDFLARVQELEDEENQNTEALISSPNRSDSPQFGDQDVASLWLSQPNPYDGPLPIHRPTFDLTSDITNITEQKQPTRFIRMQEPEPEGSMQFELMMGYDYYLGARGRELLNKLNGLQGARRAGHTYPREATVTNEIMLELIGLLHENGLGKAAIRNVLDSRDSTSHDLDEYFLAQYDNDLNQLIRVAFVGKGAFHRRPRRVVRHDFLNNHPLPVTFRDIRTREINGPTRRRLGRVETMIVDPQFGPEPPPRIYTVKRPPIRLGPPRPPMPRTEKVYVGKSTIPDAGLGLFAAIDFARDERIISYGGVFSFDPPANGLGVSVDDSDDEFMGYIDGGVARDTTVPQDARGRTLASYANTVRAGQRSVFTMNAALQQEGSSTNVNMYATRAINKDEEIFVDYGGQYYDRKDKVPPIFGQKQRHKPNKRKKKHTLTMSKANKRAEL